MSRGLALRGVCVAFALLTPLAYLCAALPPGARARPYLALHLGLSALMFAAWALAQGTAAELRWMLIAGAAARLLLFAAPAFTTHDVDRYLWDGRVAREGLDPYRIPPGAPELAALREQWRTPPEHLAHPTLYPPAALALFAAATTVGPARAPWLWKAMATLASLLLLWVCRALCEREGKGRNFCLVALSPLAVLESGVGAHVDIVAALFVALALLAFSRGKALQAGAWVGMGLLIKLIPGALLFPLLREPRAGRRWLLLGAAATALTGYGAALLLGLVPVGLLPVLLGNWRFGSPAFALLESLLGPDALPVASALAAGLLLAACAVPRLSWGARSLAALALPLAVSPVLFPWYLVPLVPLLVLAPSPPVLAWMVAAPLTYEVIDAFDAAGTWAPAVWPVGVVALMWAGATVLWGVQVRRNSRRRTATAIP